MYVNCERRFIPAIAYQRILGCATIPLSLSTIIPNSARCERYRSGSVYKLLDLGTTVYANKYTDTELIEAAIRISTIRLLFRISTRF